MLTNLGKYSANYQVPIYYSGTVHVISLVTFWNILLLRTVSTERKWWVGYK